MRPDLGPRQPPHIEPPAPPTLDDLRASLSDLGEGRSGTRVVLCCGLATLDVMQRVEHVPGPDEKLVSRGVTVAAGGPAANAAATGAALGQRARLVTALGSGPVADLVRADLEAAGVEVVDLVDGTAASPAVSTILVTESTGERAVVSVNATRTGGLGPVPDAVLDGVVVLLVDGHHLETAVDLAGRARAAGIPVVLDGGSWKVGLERLLPLVDHAVVSADFRLPTAAAWSGAQDVVADLHRIAALGPRTVARTAGAGPIRVVDARSGDELTPIEVGPGRGSTWPVVDTLGAGDVLHGAFASYVAASRGAVDVRAALVFAATVASLSVGSAGARGWVAP